jgi:DNA processing protein
VDNRRAYLILNLLPGIGPLRVSQLLSLFPSPAAVLEASAAELARVPGIGSKLASTVADWANQCDPAKELEMIEQAGVLLLTRDDADYPSLLAEIHDPPLCLYVRGNPAALARTRGGISIVGSRRTTSYGTAVTDRLATAAAVAGWPVVSGLARGIDTVAHRATVDAGGTTVAVLGCGLAYVYPQENLALARRIVEEGGALISEFPMTCRPDKRNFPMRNRIISGLTRGTVVVEAGLKSGSLITAAAATDQGRQVFAVPGRVDSPQSRGCHALIRDGARLVETFQDIAEEFSGLPGLNLAAEAASGEAASRKSAPDLTLTHLESKILSFLDENEMAIDALIVAVGEPPAQVLSTLLLLEMKRLVKQRPGRRVARSGAGLVAE